MRSQAISQMTRETATMPFCLPRRRAVRRYCSPRRVSVRDAAITHWPSAPRRYGSPLPVRPGFALAPDWMVRGVSRAHAAACPAVGNTDMSVPSSAMMTWALRVPTPVISSSRSTRPSTAASLLAQPGACPPPISPQAVQAGATPGDRRQLLLDPGIQAGDLVVDRVDQPQVQGDLEGVHLAEPAGERGGQLRRGGPQPPVAERGQRRGASLTGDQGVQEPPPAGPEQVRDH